MTLNGLTAFVPPLPTLRLEPCAQRNTRQANHRTVQASLPSKPLAYCTLLHSPARPKGAPHRSEAECASGACAARAERCEACRRAWRSEAECEKRNTEDFFCSSASRHRGEQGVQRDLTSLKDKIPILVTYKSYPSPAKSCWPTYSPLRGLRPLSYHFATPSSAALLALPGLRHTIPPQHCSCGQGRRS